MVLRVSSAPNRRSARQGDHRRATTASLPTRHRRPSPSTTTPRSRVTPVPVRSSLPVTLSAPSASPVTVDYRRSTPYGHRAGTDYTAVPSSTLTFAPGEITEDIDVEVAGDTQRELTERFSVRLSNPTGATLADATGKVAILDEEGPLTLSVSDVR